MSNVKVIFNWSSGKDSALCLYKMMQLQQYEVICLLTTISEQFQRISMHGVRVELLEAQAKSIGIPLVKIQIPESPTMENYENAMSNTLLNLKSKGATSSVFGDIFLEDLRKYREEKLEEIGLKALFPLWKIPTKDLIQEFIDLGFKTIITCVNEKFLDKSFAGRIIDENFLKDLPDNVDPCGENGEFHTFVFDGPIFKGPIPFKKGEIVYKTYEIPKDQSDEDKCFSNEDDQNQSDKYGYWYCDLILDSAE